MFKAITQVAVIKAIADYITDAALAGRDGDTVMCRVYLIGAVGMIEKFVKDDMLDAYEANRLWIKGFEVARVCQVEFPDANFR